MKKRLVAWFTGIFNSRVPAMPLKIAPTIATKMAVPGAATRQAIHGAAITGPYIEPALELPLIGLYWSPHMELPLV